MDDEEFAVAMAAVEEEKPEGKEEKMDEEEGKEQKEEEEAEKECMYLPFKYF